jgi:G protein beta subunit-like protein
VASVTVASDGSLLCAGNNAVSFLLPIPSKLLSLETKHQFSFPLLQGRVFVWRMIQNRDTTSLIPVCKFSAHNTYITRVLLSPDVRHLATCSADRTARIWAVDPNVANGALPEDPESESAAFPIEMTLHGHQRWVWDCAFSADSAYLVTACSDHYARLWELSSQGIIRQYNGHHRGCVCVALNDTALT